MDPQRAVVVGLAITLGVSGLAVVLLAPPLHENILYPNRVAARARFWRGYVGLLVVLVPLVTFLFSIPTQLDLGTVGLVGEHVRAPLAALTGTLLLIGLMVSFVPGGPAATVTATREQTDDLNRLLAKVEQIRARELVRREAEEPEEWSRPG